MKNTLATRVQEAVEAAKKSGNSVVTIANACGISRQAVYQWTDGSTKSIDGANLVELAELSGLNARWIATGKGAKTKAKPHPQNDSTPGNVVGFNRSALSDDRRVSPDIAEIITLLTELDPVGVGMVLTRTRDIHAERKAVKTKRAK